MRGRLVIKGELYLTLETVADRVAEILQLHFHHGVNLPGIAVIVGIEGSP